MRTVQYHRPEYTELTVTTRTQHLSDARGSGTKWISAHPTVWYSYGWRGWVMVRAPTGVGLGSAACGVSCMMCEVRKKIKRAGRPATSGSVAGVGGMHPSSWACFAHMRRRLRRVLSWRHPASSGRT